MDTIMATLVVLSGLGGPAETDDVAATLLYVRTTPSGAGVSLDGKRLGSSNDLFEVKPGSHEIGIDLAGHRPHRKKIKIEDGQVTRIEVQLKRMQPSPKQGAISRTRVPTGKWIDVLTTVDLAKDRVNGTWKRDEASVFALGGWHSRIKLPVEVDGDYDLEVDFTRIARVGSRGVTVIFPVGQRSCVLALSGWIGQAHGLETVDGLDPIDDESPASARPGTLVDGQRYSVRISVRTDGGDAEVTVTLDGKSLIYWAGKQASLAVPSHWKSSERKRPALGMNGCKVEFHAARVRLVSGKAFFCRPSSETDGGSETGFRKYR